jgi:hypothetical protein
MPERLSETQVQAVHEVYWQLEALADAVRRLTAGIAGEDGAVLSPVVIEAAGNAIALEADDMRSRVELLGAEAALEFEAIERIVGRLQAGQEMETAGALRGQLADLAGKVRVLTARLEEITLSFEATVGAGFGQDY